jgi:hypothetical protein
MGKETVKTEKTYKIVVEKKGRENIYEGTLEHFKKNVFGYTMEVGKSWDPKVNMNARTIKSFVTNLQKAYEAKEAQCFERSFVRLVE